jgi:FixJ family two-component response regulator
MIYVVEADPSVRDGLDRLMRSAGFAVQSFPSTTAMLEELDETRPGCVLLDLAAQAPDERSLAQRLRDRGVDMPSIALSVEAGETIDRKARAAGCCFLLRKPVDDRALLDAIDWAFGSEACRGGTRGCAAGRCPETPNAT